MAAGWPLARKLNFNRTGKNYFAVPEPVAGKTERNERCSPPSGVAAGWPLGELGAGLKRAVTAEKTGNDCARAQGRLAPDKRSFYQLFYCSCISVTYKATQQ